MKSCTMKSYTYIVLLLLAIACMIVLGVYSRPSSYRESFKMNIDEPKITCIMITGKDQARTALARSSVQNFLQQTYTSKQLLILNHGTEPVLQPAKNGNDGVFEFMIQKNTLTLGDLRNIALQMVSLRGLWTTWDDDDWRSPHYLEALQTERIATNTDVLCLSKRIDYNSNTGFLWMAHRKPGFVLFLAPVDSHIQYLSRDSMEDVSIIDEYKKRGYKVGVFDNDPLLYIRLVHTNNTSQWVNPHKTSVHQSTSANAVYVEQDLNESQLASAHKIISTYFKYTN